MEELRKNYFDFSDRLHDYIFSEFETVFDYEKKYGFPHQSLSRWLTKKTLPNVRVLMKFSEIYDCSIDFLLGLTENQKSFRVRNELDFYNRILLLLNANGIKRATLAKNCGLTKSSFSHWKKGAVPITTDLVKMANYLNCSVEYLLGISDVR